VLRCFVGAVGDEDVVEAADDELIQACARHLAAVVDLPERPAEAAVVRWRRAMPQYELGHLDRVRQIRQSLPAGIFVVGSAYDGVGIPDCVRAAGETAEMVVSHLAGAARDKETTG
jgi:oxygen-dependent protoporphyrinogen oxidase